MNMSHIGSGQSSISPSHQVRLNAREGRLKGQTSGLAPGFVQANLAILPARLADDFLRFCQRNPKPCPLLGVADPGSFSLPDLGQDIDIRRDIPMYRIWKNGVMVEETADVSSQWRDDLVSFLIGCSFSFEEALIADGIDVRHVSCGTNVPMYRSNIATQPAGPFHGSMVVSMRPMKAADAIRAIQITSRFPSVHGAPVHIGDPRLIGIADLGQPDYGDPVGVRQDEIPVFWACGVTPQSVLANAKPDFCITHSPGCMLVTDLKNTRLAVM